MAAGRQRAALEERKKQLIRAMADYIDSPALNTAREQLTVCQTDVAEELARLHQALLEKEAQLAHQGELEQEIARRETSLAELDAQAAELKETIKQTEVSQGILSGQREHLEDNLRRELSAHLQACPLQDAPAAIAQALAEATETLTQMDELKQELGTNCEKSRS